MINPEQLEKNPEVILVIKGERINARYISPTARRDLGIRTAEDNAVFAQEDTEREYIQTLSMPYSDLIEEGNLVRLIDDKISGTLYWQTGSLSGKRETFRKLHKFLHSQEVAQ